MRRAVEAKVLLLKLSGDADGAIGARIAETLAVKLGGRAGVARDGAAALKPARSRARPPGPSAETRRLCVISESGLVWSMNWLSWLEPKNSRTAAAAGLALIRSCGMTVSMSTELMRSLIARSMRKRPMRYWFSISSPTERTRRLPR